MSSAVPSQAHHGAYVKFHGRSIMDKAINSLLGIVEGISLDGVVNPVELGFLNIWLAEHQELADGNCS